MAATKRKSRVKRIQVHTNGAYIVIDRTNNKLRYEHGFGKTEEYRLNERWIQKYAKCCVCKKPVSDEKFAFALWKHSQEICSTECRLNDRIKRYGCCKKAKPRNCVCLYSFECPKHGVTCVGSHE